MATELHDLRPATPISAAGQKWIDDTLGRLTLAQKAAQCLVILPSATTDGTPDDATFAAVRGGLGVLHSITDLTASTAARYHSTVGSASVDAGLPPVFITGNLEAGVGYSLGATGTDFPYPRGIGMSGDEDLAYRVARRAAEEARTLGYRWTLSPCVDVVTTPDDPILGVRAYGVDAPATSALGSAQIRGYQDAGVLATAKHFPGHGDSAVDSHLDLPRIDRTSEDHAEVHLAPFRSAIDAGVASIMVAHVVLPALGVDEPASLSSLVNTGWLREELGYDGLIITDSLRMKAVAARYDAGTAAVLALRAGADVANVKCPADQFPAVLAHVVGAVKAGELSESALDAAVARLLAARWRAGADRPVEYDEAIATRYDPPLEWNDEDRRSTVTVSTARPVTHPLRPGTSYAVIGDTGLARRVTELIRERGFAAHLVADRPTAATLAAAAAQTAEPSLIPVVQPSLPMTGDERRQLTEATATPGVARAVVAVLVNSAAEADSLPDTGCPLVTMPAVDAFEMVTDAAVRAAVDALC
ncbi:glycoside hydrolase family 3 protein [Phytoactinopolyspora halotolerans]|uniref:Glycoside hydrolase family 3 N-terminal domain-containing protein n=1 Tax=Phytoactinopolyspora halotolerans TaxID=1981512 RepID=A0A6L9S4K5_9ACTN|nr:glycoside hydrolase family 3 N-terminal domain-containing protein [Phytoactinopolyspora halotolerans]NEE00415.1 hypothetical protein [Phytoactinopolyspora halotolerans]